MKKIMLRAHHLLCIQKFVGEGYDGVFTENLSKIAAYLRAHPEAEIAVTDGCDEVCKSCPNRVGNVCTDGEKILKLDGGVLDTCKLICGGSGTWENLSRKAEELIFKTDKFETICGECQWYNLCKDKAE